MGKRKSSRKIVKKEKPKLDTTFDCLFCNHEKSIIVSMDKEHKVGNLKCKVCSATYQAALTHLSEPIDVYSEWVDACEEAKHNEDDDYSGTPPPSAGAAAAQDDYGIPEQLSEGSDVDDF
ncbi:hypothetical protein FBU59_005046 [Linderina macrospora]|uniref:Uncharacterized protein n=1 Tax=Linderina macrospora TaxID=4868 RepID=A0ACC1J3S8_9FUNG|nr:hypothetical protein FBU59_005046 [Linderina macrospora]